MNSSIAFSLLISTLLMLILPLHASSNDAPEKWMGGLALKAAKDINPDAGVFETELVAAAAEVEIDGTVVRALAYNGQVPGPLIRVREGDTVIVNFLNNMDTPATIHWHGLAGDNDNDGSQLTQYAVPPGGTHKYEFVAGNAGNHWYHSHVNAAQTIFQGLYGGFIVVSEEEEDLQAEGVLPKEDGTLVLADTTFDSDGNVRNVEDVSELEHMNGVEGDTLLVNGKPNAQLQVKAGKPFMLRIINSSISRYWRLKLTTGKLVKVGGENGLLDTAVLSGGEIMGMKMPMQMDMHADMPMHTDMPMHSGMTMISCSSDVDCPDPYLCMGMNMCGMMGKKNLGYESGEILLGPAMRATVVITPPETPGSFELQWHDFDRGTHSMKMKPMAMCENSDMCTDPEFPECMLMKIGGMRMCGRMIHDGGYQNRPPQKIVTFHVSASPQESYEPFVEGTPLSTNVGTPLEDLSGMSVVPNVVWRMNNRINFQGHMDQDGTYFTIDGVQWPYGMGLSDSFPGEAPSSRHVSLGDLVEFEVHNHSEMHHPFHLHGFPFQPLFFMEMHHDEGWMFRYDAEAKEYLDTVDIPPHTSIVARMKVEDVIAGSGFAKGRWLFHCHLVQHSERGMISELVVE